MKIIKTKLIPKQFCMNFFGIILTQDDSWITKYVINHEKIHTAQMKELLYIFFYIIYVFEFLVRYIINKFNWHKSYMEISFEKEAYNNEYDLTYLETRKHYSMWRKNK